MTTTRTDTLPEPTDDREARERALDVIGPGGQLALLGAAQRGLDGRYYAVSTLPSGEAASSPLGQLCAESASLGPHAEISEPLRPPERPSNRRQQLALPLADRQQAPQLDMWTRHRKTKALRDLPEGNRISACARVRYMTLGELMTERVHGKRADTGKWSLLGTVSCNSYACPLCAPRRAREVAGKIAIIIDEHRARFPTGDIGMLTLEVPHKATDTVDETLRWLYKARAEFVQTTEFRRWSKSVGLSTRVFVLDATFGGPSGTHPHFHGLTCFERDMGKVTRRESMQATIDAMLDEQQKRITSRRGLLKRAIERDAMTDEQVNAALAQWQHTQLWNAKFLDEQIPFPEASEAYRAKAYVQLVAPLVTVWERVVEKWMRRDGRSIERFEHFRQHAITLTPAEQASTYFVKWGLADEIGKPHAKGGGHLRLLDYMIAYEHDVDRRWVADAALDLYRAWVTAVHGKRWVIGLGDACKRYSVSDGAVELHYEALRAQRAIELEREGKEPPMKVRELNIAIRDRYWRTFLRLGHDVVFAKVDAYAEIHQGEPEQARFEQLVQEQLDAWLQRNHHPADDSPCGEDFEQVRERKHKSFAQRSRERRARANFSRR